MTTPPDPFQIQVAAPYGLAPAGVAELRGRFADWGR